MSILFLLLQQQATVLAQTPAATLPSFTFLSMDNKPFTEKNIPAGKQLFFIFFDPGCEHCQRTVANINRQYKSFAKAQIMMVSMDKADKITQFIDTYAQQLKMQKNVLLLQDRQYQFITNFKPKKYPALFLYTAAKKLLLYSDNENDVPKFVELIQGKAK